MKIKITILGLLLFIGIFSAKAQGGSWNCGNFSVTCLDTIVDDCYLNIVCSGNVSITNLDSVNSLTCLQTLNTVTGSPVGWSYNLCNPNGCLPLGVFTSTFVVPPLATRNGDFQAHINNNFGNPILNVSFKDNNNTAIGTTFHIQLGTGLTSIDEQSVTDNSLSQNIPNPFSGTSVINYKLLSGKGSLVITDVLGRTINNYILTSTVGSITIGDGLGSGVFFCTLMGENGNTLAIRKIISQ